MIYLIIGKQGSGKSHLADCLKHNGLTEATSIENISESDFIITDFDGISTIASAFPAKTFCVLSVMADDAMRRVYALKNTSADERKIAETEFDENEKLTQKSFDILNDAIESFRQNLNVFPENVTNVIEYPNDYSDERMKRFAAFIKNHSISSRKLSGIIKDAIPLGILKTSNTDPTMIRISTNDSSEKYAHIDTIAGTLMNNTTAFWDFMTQYINLSNRFADL